MHCSLSSSSSSSFSDSSYISCTRLQSKKYPKPMAPRQEIPRYVDRSFMESEDVMSSYSMQKTPAASRYGELDCPHIIEQCNKSAEAQGGDGNLCKQGSKIISNSKSNYSSTWLPVCHSNDNLKHMCNEAIIPSSKKTSFKPSTTPNSSPNNCVQGRELLEEGQGECNPGHVCSVKGSPSLWDHSEDLSWRRLSPAAASCFCKDIEEEQEYFQQILGSSSHGWTDEKHSSYLDSMEADFLRSFMFEGTAPHAERSPDLDDSASSHQAKAVKEFKVCQSGKWRPVYVQAPYINIGPLKQLAVAVKNPWIKRFRASKRAYFPSLIMEDPLLEDVNARCSAQQHE